MLTITRAPFKRVARIDQRENRLERRRLSRISFHSIRATFDDRWSEPIRPSVVVHAWPARHCGSNNSPKGTVRQWKIRKSMKRRLSSPNCGASRMPKSPCPIMRLRRRVRAKTERLRALRLAQPPRRLLCQPPRNARNRKKPNPQLSRIARRTIEGGSEELKVASIRPTHRPRTAVPSFRLSPTRFGLRLSDVARDFSAGRNRPDRSSRVPCVAL